MTKNRQFFNLFLLLLGCTVVMFIISYGGPKAVEMLTNQDQNLSNGKTIQPVKATGQVSHKSAAKQVTIDQVSLQLNTIPEGLKTVLLSNKNIEIPAQSTFSLMELLKKQKLEKVSSETLSILATAIYQSILPTNFTIAERNISRKLPVYADLGLEAKLNPSENMDLAFVNPNKTKYQLKLQLKNNHLKVSLLGGKLTYQYKITTADAQQFLPKTVVQYSPLLSSGQIKLASAGISGQDIKVYRTSYRDHLLVTRELISDDYYAPECRVEIHPVAPASTQQTTVSIVNTAQTGSNTATSQLSQAGQQNTTSKQSQTVSSQVQTKGSQPTQQSTGTNAKNQTKASAAAKGKSANKSDVKSNQASK